MHYTSANVSSWQRRLGKEGTEQGAGDLSAYYERQQIELCLPLVWKASPSPWILSQLLDKVLKILMPFSGSTGFPGEKRLRWVEGAQREFADE